jgi:ABC-2 type transport system ATP-binding protein
MISPRKHNHALNFMYSGRVEELIRVLAGQEVTDLLIEEPTLEEIFMHYYDEEEDPEAVKQGPVQ